MQAIPAIESFNDRTRYEVAYRAQNDRRSDPTPVRKSAFAVVEDLADEDRLIHLAPLYKERLPSVKICIDRVAMADIF